MDGFIISCDYCGPEPLFLSTPSKDQDELEWRKAWKAAQSQLDGVDCPQCGARYGVEDDDVPVDQGGSVVVKNVSTPRLDSLTIGSGARTGGEALYINGSALDIGILVVKFGGNDVLDVTNRSPTQARIVTPRGQYTLFIETWLEEGFIVGEEVRSTSGVSAALRSISPFVVDGPTRAFLPNEEVTGVASGGRIRLSNQPYSGVVDVTVNNQYGQRHNGNTLTGGFTYV